MAETAKAKESDPKRLAAVIPLRRTDDTGTIPESLVPVERLARIDDPARGTTLESTEHGELLFPTETVGTVYWRHVPPGYAVGTFAAAIPTPAEQMAELRERLRTLEDLVKSLTHASQEEAVVQLRDVPKEQAKEEIIQLFRSGEVLDYGVIAERLRLELPLVVSICNELEREGVIG